MFSNDSRWDRHTPDQSHEGQLIEVGAIFKNGSIRPVTFVWSGRKYRVKEITYQWKDRRGQELLYYFTVTDGASLFQIYFNSRWTHWRLEKTCPL